MKSTFKDLTGRRYGILTITALATTKYPQKWLCRCDCGNYRLLFKPNLSSGNTKSCGCAKLRFMSENLRRHGMHATPIYKIYTAMIHRCSRDVHKNRRYYGRGIRVCDRWRDSFENFYADMGDRPEGKSLDRIDNDGPYSPQNCRWASHAEQARNKCNSNLIAINGKTQCLTDWALECKLDISIVSSRFRRGKRGEELIKPAKHRKLIQKGSLEN